MEITETKTAIEFLDAAKKHIKFSLADTLGKLEQVTFACDVKEKIVEVLNSLYDEDHSVAAKINRLAKHFQVDLQVSEPPSLRGRVTSYLRTALPPLAKRASAAVYNLPFLAGSTAALVVAYAPEEIAQPIVAAAASCIPAYFIAKHCYQKRSAAPTQEIAKPDDEDAKTELEQTQTAQPAAT